MSINNSNFTIKDNSSEIATHLPKHMIEHLTILARIRGYKGIDDYIISMIQDELISIKDGAQGITDIGQDIIKYLERLGVTSSSSSSSSFSSESESDKEVLKWLH